MTMLGVGVLDHRLNPTIEQVETQARVAEAAGARWLTISDNSTWRDTWILTAAAAGVTDEILLGPGVTNPYLRHPFHTAAALATIHELSGNRAMLGVGAGGSALSASADISRRDAPTRVAELIELVRRAASGGPLDPVSGLSLDRGDGFEMAATPVMVAGRKDEMLRCAGAHADWALMWRIPMSDLERVSGLIREGASTAGRTAGPEMVWCPLVAWDERIRPHLRMATVFSALESPPDLFRRWGLSVDTRQEIKSVVMRHGIAAAASLVPDSVADDVILPDADPASVAEMAKAVGATAIAVRNFETDALQEGVNWARDVTAML
jgi:5,10-methylenetetrahydromethanopterin reductase